LRSWFDRMLLVLLVVASLSACSHCLSLAAVQVACTTSFTLASGVLVAWLGGILPIDTVLVLVTNIFVIAPFNVAVVVLYYTTWPLQQPIWRWVQWKAINLISIPPQPHPVSYWDSSFVKFLDILPGAFKALLPPDCPFDDIDAASQESVRDAFDKAPWLQAFGAIVKKQVPAGVLGSLVVRLISQMIMVPTLGWWWIHLVYLNFLPLGHRPPATYVPAEIPPLPPVEMYMPKCYILSEWRKAYGEELGRQKCLNE